MKKVFLMAVCCLTAISTMAIDVKVERKDGRFLFGNYVSSTDTSLVLTTKSKETGAEETITCLSYQVAAFWLGGIKYSSVDGKFTKGVGSGRMSPVQEVQDEQLLERAQTNTARLTYEMGKTLCGVGKISLAMGVPTLLAGVVCCAIGHTGDVTEDKAHLQEAGCYLMPTGAALTLVGIPLCIKGKQLMHLNLGTTGTGATARLTF